MCRVLVNVRKCDFNTRILLYLNSLTSLQATNSQTMNLLLRCLGLALLLFYVSCTTESEPTVDISEPEENVPDENEPDESEEEEEEETDSNSSEVVSWTVFNKKNSGIPSNFISDIEFDSKGDAWLVTWFNYEANGFVHYDGTNWISFNTETSNLEDNLLIDIAIDEVDAKWIASWKNGLYWYKDGEWIHYGSNNSGIPSDELTCIGIDNDQYKWIGTDKGLVRYRGGEWTLYNKDNSPMTSNLIGAVNVDKNNKVWVKTDNELLSIDGEDFKVFNLPEYLPNQNNSIAFNNDEVWIVAGYGIASLIDEKWTFYDYFEENSCLTDCQIRTISFKGNELWLGNFAECNNGGLQNFDKCKLYTTENSDLPNGLILSLNFDADGNAWVGTLDGLAIMKFQ